MIDCINCQFNKTAVKVLYEPEYEGIKVNNCFVAKYNEEKDDIDCFNFFKNKRRVNKC
jgi:hypothetical protein